MWNRNVVIGLFVIAGIALFALGIFLIGNQHRAFAGHIELYTRFANINGVTKGTKVRVAGFDAGEVVEVGVPDSPSSRFRLELTIDQRIHSLVRTDSLVTIATEGVVGDKFLLVHPGSAQAPEAPPHSTLPSKELFEMSDLIDQTAGLMKDASGTMKAVQGQLTETLGSVTTTVNNINDLAVGLKQGKGTVGMLLRDDTTATNVKQAVANVRQATASLNHASQQADALISDFQSRELGQKADETVSKADETMSSVQSAARNFDATSQQLHQTLTAAFSPDAQGVDAGTNIRQSLSSLNRATGNMAEDTEALKRGFFFRGYFKKRGYYSLAHLNPDTYRTDKLFANSRTPRVWLEAAELFEPQKDGDEALCPAGKARIDAAIAQLGDAAFGGALVIEGYSTTGDSGDEIAASRDRAILVRQYLYRRFQLDLQRIGTVALRGVPPPSTHKDRWDGVSIVLLKPSPR